MIRKLRAGVPTLRDPAVPEMVMVIEKHLVRVMGTHLPMG